ncbi:diaminopimelate epimerase [Mesonia aestuariivivens]|uniref:Diaminopimelate epimerase n=1 Tax=Mesonia aestuariivivens TaxID=2796128 RepID=A0ABS6W0V5_9FLAO|nr:diaminopimelate epimerase [Mesonia aestuariivivens]MBW2961486.1 diaminopimelate epimerase [Mesonia aestuariivivens]
MTVKFYKYQGTGNDFIMIDNREMFFKNDTKIIQHLCDRKFGIGADGLILLEHSEDKEDDFKMVYFNSDGNQSTMCGNGGRCLVRFAEFLNIVDKSATFTAIDGKHRAKIENDKIHLQMQNVHGIKELGDEYFLDTGSPHHIVFTSDVHQLDVKKEGAAIRYNDIYKNEGTNVNFVEPQEEILQARTYERGVEDETLSCGTGVTAVAIAATFAKKYHTLPVKIKTPGGLLEVNFKQNETQFTEVWLSGPALQVFQGDILC